MVGTSVRNRPGPQQILNDDLRPPTDASPTLIQRIGKWMPGVNAIRHYQRAWLPRDLVAGLVLCALLVPQGMAYAELAGLPAITGLYLSLIHI